MLSHVRAIVPFRIQALDYRTYTDFKKGHMAIFIATCNTLPTLNNINKK